MTSRRMSKSDERRVVKIYALAEVKQEWKTEAAEEELSLSRYLHNLIQESRAMRQQGRLKIGDRRRVEELQQEIDQLETKLENRNQTGSHPDMGSNLIQARTLEELVSTEYKPLDQLLRELVGSEEVQQRLRNELKSELYRSANQGQVEYRRGSGWKTLENGSGRR